MMSQRYIFYAVTIVIESVMTKNVRKQILTRDMNKYTRLNYIPPWLEQVQSI